MKTIYLSILIGILIQINSIQLLKDSQLNIIENEEEPFAIDLIPSFDMSKAIKDTKSKKISDDITAYDLMNELGFGWSLGNTLDACGNGQNEGLQSETSWGNPYTTAEMIKAIAEKGIKTIRLPTSWHNHLIDNQYTIDPKWMERIKTIVDWSLEAGLYVILNTHHDNAENNQGSQYGKGYYPLRKDRQESEKFLFNIWKQIALAFNNGYDEHLIFEDLNEPRLKGTQYEWNYEKGNPMCEEASSVLNEYHRLVLKTIRETGGNNQKRFVVFPGLSASYVSAAESDLIIPGDKKYNPTNTRTLVSVHMYIPYQFCQESSFNYREFTEAHKNELYGDFKTLFEKYTLKGMYVVIGEMGAINKNNTMDRVNWGEYFIKNARKFQMPSVIWDNNVHDNSQKFEDVFGLFDRSKLDWPFDEMMNTFVAAAETPMEKNPEENYKDNLLSEPVVFSDPSWKVSISINAGALSGMTGFSKVCFHTSTNVPFHADYKKMKLNDGNWKQIIVTQAELKNAILDPSDNSFTILDGEQDVEVTLNDQNIKILSSKGMILFGYGFKMNTLFIGGPRMLKFEPLHITKSDNEQTIKLYFTDDSTQIVNLLKFYNFYFDINGDVHCSVEGGNPKIANCKGVFKYTGDFELRDNQEHALINRMLYVDPPSGQKYDIDNLLDVRVNFDEENRQENKIVLDKNLFSDMNKENQFFIETNDLIINPPYRYLKIFKGNSDNIMEFKQEEVNCTIRGDKSIEVPPGRKLIRFILNENNSKTFKGQGTSINGFGFSARTIYYKNTINE